MKNKFLGIICFIYSIIILYVWISGLMKSFLAPNMQIYLKISVVPMFILGICLSFNNHYQFKYSDLVLLLPLVMLIVAGDGNLSIKFAQSRMTSISNKYDKREKATIEEPSEIIDVEDPFVDGYYFDITDSVYSYLADYITYMSGARAFEGKTIRFRGFALDYSEYLTSEYIAVGKYAITCCAADAEFTGFMVKYDPAKVKYGNWYEVEGILRLGVDNEGYAIMTVDAVKVKEINPKSEEQMVYSCSAYGDGRCSELLKYDLVY